MNRYCVGPAMAIDWGEGETELCPADRRRMMARVLSYFRPYWRPGLLVVACIAIQAVLGLAPAVVFKSLIDTLAHPHPSFAHVGLLVAAGIGAAVAGGLTGVGEAYLSTRISQGIVATLRRELFGRLLDQPVGFFTDRKAGDLLSRINTDIDGVEDVVTDTVFGLVSSALVTVATLALMLRFSWQLTLAVLVMIPLVALPARRAGRATYQARARTQSLRGQMTGYLQEILGISGIMLVKAFGREPAERQRFAAMNAGLRNLEWSSGRWPRRSCSAGAARWTTPWSSSVKAAWGAPCWLVPMKQRGTGRLPPSGMRWRRMSQPRACGSEQGSSPPAYRERLPFRSESGDFVGPQRPVGELVEGGPPGALDQAVLADPAGIHAGPAAAYVGTVAGGRFDHAVEVVVAVRHLLAGHGAADRIAEQEHADLGPVAAGQRAGQPQPVPAALSAVGRVVQDHQRLHAHHPAPTATGRPASRHSGIPSARRRASKPRARSRSTAWGASTQYGPRQ